MSNGAKNNAAMALLLREVIDLIESGDFDEDVFLDFIREGHTSDLSGFTKSYGGNRP